MGKLFIALDGAGSARFIGEVGRGAECGCVCPECGSPLVARQGASYDWHFAHEAAGQERPECGAGTQRLLRQIAIDHLRARETAGTLSLPPYRQEVTLQRSLAQLREEVRWGAQSLGPWTWEDGHVPVNEPVARARLDTGVELQVFVQVDEAAPAPIEPASPDGDVARLVFQCRLPSASVLRERGLTEQHLQVQAELQWRHHPDTLGLLRAAQERLEARSGKIYGSWLNVVEAERQAAPEAAAPSLPLFYSPAEPATDEAARRHDCAPAHASNATFTFYRVSESQAWLLYLLERQDDGAQGRAARQKDYALAPYPNLFEDWAQAVPAALGLADPVAGIVRVTGFLDAVAYLSQRALTTRSSRDPADFVGL